MSISPRRFVDTNIFVHSLFPEAGERKHRRCVALFEKAEKGKIGLWTTEWVISELVWFLDKQKFSWENIKFVLNKIFTTRLLEVRGKAWMIEVVDLCRKSKDFNDAINILLAFSEDVTEGYSYDKALDRWKGFTRLEP